MFLAPKRKAAEVANLNKGISMIFKNIFKNIQNASSRDLRYLLYLSRNNNWVNVDGDLYKITIKHIVKETQRYKEGKLCWAEEHELVSSSNEPDKESNLKLHLSQTAFSTTVHAGGNKDQYYGEHSDLLSDLELNISSHFFEHLCVSYYAKDKYEPDYLSSQLMNICLYAENFDSIFTQQIDSLTNDEERIIMIKGYQEQKKLAYEEASKNAIWSAASSGDYKLLEYLLENIPTETINLNSTFNGKYILKTMFDNNPKTDIPFKSIMYPKKPKQDYTLTFNLLIKHGLDKEKVAEFYSHYCSANTETVLYPQKLKDHNELIPIIESYLYLQESAKIHKKVTLTE